METRTACIDIYTEKFGNITLDVNFCVRFNYNTYNNDFEINKVTAGELKIDIFKDLTEEEFKKLEDACYKLF